jgi:cell division protein FtsI (penicillin-binding protein 3)
MGVVVAGLCLAFVVVVGRVVYLQVVQQEDLAGRAVRVDREFTFKARRGSILDRNGVELAVTVKAPSVYANPRRVEDPERTARALASLLDLDEAKLRKRLSNPKRSFVWVKRQVTPALGEAVTALELDGVGLQHEHKRFYPQGDLAGQIVGFVGVDGNGLEGAERVLESRLAGAGLTLEGKRDVRGRMLLDNQSPDLERLEGHSVVLTLDQHMQRVAQDALEAQVAEYDAKGGYAVAIDIQTGEILALANTPKFNPNQLKEHTSSDWRLRNLTDTFEPGSVVKPLVLAAALEEGTVRLGTMFECENGRIKIGRYTIRDSHAHDQLTAAEVVKVSSNICAYKMAQTYGKEKLYGYLRAFGFGSRAGVGMPGEQPGLVWPADRWAEVSFANVAFGQGFTATPLQVVSSIAAIGNDGMLLRPRLIKRIVDRDGDVVEEGKVELVRRVVSADSARKAAWAMSLVTMEGGTAKRADMEHFTVAGKTGTAQKVNPETRRYDPNMWVASFVGFFPAERPRVAIGVMIDEPHGSHYGGVVAAPVWTQIADAAIASLDILPVPESERFDRGEEPEDVARKGKKSGEEGDEPVAYASPEDARVEAPRVGQDGAIETPDLTGMTMRQALAQSRALGALPRASGWGRVVSQRPEPGAPWAPGQTLELEFSPATRQDLVAEEPAAGGAE